MNSHSPQDDSPTSPAAPLPLPSLLTRAGLGGALMGMANLVPGISGGTMLLATGVFPAFVQAVADVSRLRFNRRSLLLIGVIAFAAALVIGPLAQLLSQLVLQHTWLMYSLFIGLTLGGVPLIWRMADHKGRAFAFGAVVGLMMMVTVALLQIRGAGTGGDQDGFAVMLLAGVAAASAMVLPGVSGGYLLLVLGVYVPILDGVGQIFTGLRALDFDLLLPPVFQIALPVGLGVVFGIAGVSNLVKWLLNRFPRQTLGVLLGLLLGAVVGLWPFQRPTEPEPGTLLKGQTLIELNGVILYEQTGRIVEPKDFPFQYFRPTPGQVGGAAALILIGFAATFAITRIGDRRPR